ncbi:MAG: PTS glucose transporter subunit IIA [Lachnospiraceae bacterium]|nr:PTS glucose transporter subunit IIA [Lachnospiraceae bacterium]
MALDYRKCAEEIAANIGGGENVVSAAHCATRLRLVIADNDKLNKKALEDIDGVQGMFESGGQLQLIIGTGTVNKVYDEFLAVTGASAASKEDVKAAAAAQAPLWRRIIKALGDVFVPILPAIVSCGLMMGLMEALSNAIPGFGDTDWYGFLHLIAVAAIAYLPILVGISAARVFGANIFLGATLGIAMLDPSLLNAWNVGSPDAINAFFGVTDGKIPTWDILFFHVQRHGYQGHIIPVIIAVFIMAQIETWLHKHVPEMIDLFVTPLCTILATYFLTFTIIGPIFSALETVILSFFSALVTVGFGIGALACGAIYPFTVVMGLHHMFNIIELGMLAQDGGNGLNTWMPIASSANFAQFAACLAVGIKSHRTKTKAIAVPASMSAALGITEPAIFGVNLRYLKPLVCGSIGGAIGAMSGSIMGVAARANGVTGIPGYLIVTNPVTYTIMLAIAFGVAFALAFITHKDEEDETAAPDERAVEVEENVPNETKKAAEQAAAKAVELDKLAPVIKASKSTNLEIVAPITGEVVDYTEIPDGAFASGALGNGVGIKPDTETVVSPFDGEIVSVVDSKHAVGIAGENGVELLIHVGIDTVQMNGDGFECYVGMGDKVKKGDKLVSFSRDKIAAAGYSDMVVVLVTNSFEFDEVASITK